MHLMQPFKATLKTFRVWKQWDLDLCGLMLGSMLISLTFHNHEGARHRRKPLGRRKGLNISINAGFTKIRAFEGKCGQEISTSVGFTKIRAFEGKWLKDFYFCSCGKN